MTVKLYGIANCDKVRAARKWLASRHIEVDFHDYKKNGVDASALERWMKHHDWSELINRNGTTWRGLTEVRRNAIISKAEALKAMIEMPSLIRRPVIEHNGDVAIGFDPARFGG
jgi:arsenate reductase